MSKEVTTSYHKTSLLDYGIIKDIPITTDETIEKAREVLDAIKRITENKKCPLLVDIKNQRSISREARRFYSSKEFTDNVTALLLLLTPQYQKCWQIFILGLIILLAQSDYLETKMKPLIGLRII